MTCVTSAILNLKTQNEEDVDAQYEGPDAEDANSTSSRKKNKKEKSKGDKIEKEKSSNSKAAKLKSDKDAAGSVNLVPAEGVSRNYGTVEKPAISNTSEPKAGSHSGEAMALAYVILFTTFVMVICCFCCCMYIWKRVEVTYAAIRTAA